MNTTSRMRIARSMCIAVLSLMALSACGSTSSGLDKFWYDQHGWEGSKDS